MDTIVNALNGYLLERRTELNLNTSGIFVYHVKEEDFPFTGNVRRLSICLEYKVERKSYRIITFEVAINNVDKKFQLERGKVIILKYLLTLAEQDKHDLVHNNLSGKIFNIIDVRS